MTRRKNWLLGLAITIFVIGIVVGVYYLNRVFGSSIDAERENQLKELTVQVKDTFENALSFNQTYAASAKRMLEADTYASEADMVAAIGQIENALDVGEDGAIFVAVDSNGYCYDANGRQGIWGDFDQLSGDAESYTFIADSVTFEGTHWAFAEKLGTPLETADGAVTVSYVVLLCPVESLEGYHVSESYNDIGETYILKENGTRMYDSVSEEDTISSYNVYKILRGEDDGTFDTVLAELAENGVASGVYEQDGQKYIYSLAWHEENGVVLLYLIPASAVASDTTAMVSALTRILILAAAFVMVFLCVMIYIVTKTNNDRKMFAQKEQNMHEIEAMNARLKAMNQSLSDANRAAKGALAVAVSANRAKSSFLSNMSHDIRTPLNAILGCQKLLDASVDNPEKVREFSGKIAMAGSHLLALINDILDMSRIESGKTTLNTEPFDLEKLVGELRTLMATQVQNKNQTFIVENKAGRLFLLGDSARLSQILTNLLSNAVKYTQEGGRIEFKTERLMTENKRVALIRFLVRDNGMGMGEEFQKRIFEPFTREESALVNGISGAGLGMSITKNLVDLMGGIILVESRQGMGSTFTVELSFRLSDEAEKTDSAETDENLNGVLQGRHFLLAEDTDINAEILTELLAMEGATCDIACNGMEAVERFTKAAAGTYDAILMDVQMPVMNGYEATKEIRASGHPQAATIPIAALTANAFAEDVQRAIEAGMNTHIAKPVEMKKLREFVASF